MKNITIKCLISLIQIQGNSVVHREPAQINRSPPSRDRQALQCGGYIVVLSKREAPASVRTVPYFTSLMFIMLIIKQNIKEMHMPCSPSWIHVNTTILYILIVVSNSSSSLVCLY